MSRSWSIWPGRPVSGPPSGKSAAATFAFYSRESGLRLEARADTPAEAAAILQAMRDAGYPGGLLLCVPCPAEAARPADEMEQAITQAVREAAARGLYGKTLTPFLLGRVSELTEGKSRAANLALLRNNARVAAQVAAAIQPEARHRP